MGSRRSMIRRSQAGELDDDDDIGRTVEQREQMSEQMTELLLSRVGNLGQTIGEYKKMLQEDLNTNSTNTHRRTRLAKKGMLHRRSSSEQTFESNFVDEISQRKERDLQRLPWSRVITSQHLFADKIPKRREKKRAVANNVESSHGLHSSFASNNASSKRISVARKESTLSNTPKKTAKRGLLLSTDSKKLKKIEFERDLHVIAESNVTRSVENTARKPSQPLCNNIELSPESSISSTESLNQQPTTEQEKESNRLRNKSDKLKDHTIRTPFNTHCNLLVAYVLTVIRIPERENIGFSMCKVLQSKIVCSIVDILFWYIHCLCFGQRSKDRIPIDTELNYLRASLSTLYVKLLGELRDQVNIAKLDTVYKYLPYAIAHAIIIGFRYLCPGSRHMYTYDFKTTVYKTCCNILLGIEICDVSLQQMRKKLFPEESHNDPIVNSDKTSNQTVDAEKEKESKTTSAQNNTPAIDQNAYAEIHESLKEKPETISKKQITKLLAKRMRQSRVKFDGKMQGNLMDTFMSYTNVGYIPKQQVKHYDKRKRSSVSTTLDSLKSSRSESTLSTSSAVTSISKSVVQQREEFLKCDKIELPPTNLITRTLPSPTCRVGTSQTYRSRHGASIAKRRSELLQNYQQTKEEVLLYSQKCQSKLVSDLRKVNVERDKVLNGGVENVSRFCLDLIKSKYRHEEETSESHDKLQWHKNLDPRKPPCERVLAAMHKINHLKAQNRKSYHSTAKAMLTNMRI